MRRLVLLLALLPALALGQVTIVGSDTVKSGCVLGALNATCVVRLAGQANVGMVVTAATSPVLTLTPELSFDGTNWVSSTFDDPSTWLKATTLANPTVGMSRTLMPGGGSLQARVRVSAYTSGSCTVQVQASTMQDPSEGFSGPVGALGVPPAVAYLGTRDATTATTGTALISGTSNQAAEWAGLHTLPAVARSAISAGTAGRATSLITDATTGFQVVSLGDATTFTKQQVASATDATAAAGGAYVLPAIARATPTATTAARAEALQVETVTGGLYTSSVATTAATGLSTAVITANTATSVKASAGNVYGVSAANAAATVCYLQFYNASAPTCGTSVVWSIALPPTPGVVNITSPIPLANHATAIGTCTSTTATGGVTCGSAVSATIFFK